MPILNGTVDRYLEKKRFNMQKILKGTKRVGIKTHQYGEAIIEKIINGAKK